MDRLPVSVYAGWDTCRPMLITTVGRTKFKMELLKGSCGTGPYPLLTPLPYMKCWRLNLMNRPDLRRTECGKSYMPSHRTKL